MTLSKSEYDRQRYERRKAERAAQRPPDPIELLTPTECAYTAGLIDGEGTLILQSVGPAKRTETWYPTARIIMTHEGVITWLCERTHAHKMYRAAPRHRDKFINGTKPQFHFQLFGKRAQILCRMILPYLQIKRAQAETIIEYPMHGQVAPGIKLPPEIQARRAELRARMLELNGRSQWRTKNDPPE